jgi:hypothetical protein
MAAPILSTTEEAQFRRYIEELMIKQAGTAAPPVPPTQLPISNLPVSPPSAPNPHELMQTLYAQQQTMLELQRESLLKQQQQQTNSVKVQPMDTTIQPSAPSISLSPKSIAPAAGLSPIQQAQLLGQTMDQSDRIMKLSEQLVQLQTSAMRPPLSSLQPSNAPSPHRAPATLQSVAVGGHQANFADLAIQHEPVRTQAAVQTTGSAGVKPTTGLVDPASWSLRNSLTSIIEMNEQLRRSNASADEMEKAIRASQELLRRQGTLHAASEGTVQHQAAMESLRKRAAQLEMELRQQPTIQQHPQNGYRSGDVSPGAVGRHLLADASVRNSSDGQRDFDAESTTACNNGAGQFNGAPEALQLSQRVFTETYSTFDGEQRPFDYSATAGIVESRPVSHRSVDRRVHYAPNAYDGPPKYQVSEVLCRNDAAVANLPSDLGSLLKSSAGTKRQTIKKRSSSAPPSKRPPCDSRYSMYAEKKETRKRNQAEKDHRPVPTPMRVPKEGQPWALKEKRTLSLNDEYSTKQRKLLTNHTMSRLSNISRMISAL